MVALKSPLIVISLLLIVTALALVTLIGTETCNAHGGHGYQPPPPPPQPPGGGGPPTFDTAPGTPGGASAPGGPQNPGGPSTPPGGGNGGGSTPPPPPPNNGPKIQKTGFKGTFTPGQGGGGTPQKSGRGGAFTKKNQAVTGPSNLWEEWWARNRYQFFDFPGRRNDLKPVFTPKNIATKNNPPRARAATSPLMKRAVTTLRLCLSDSSSTARLKKAALISLGRLGDDKSLDRMKDLLSDGNHDVRTAAILALGLSGHGQARYALLNVAKGTALADKLIGQTKIPDEMRGFAELSIALHETMGAVSVLQEVAADRRCNDAVRAMALEGLGLIGGPDAVRSLIGFSKNNKNDYRLVSAAVAALGKTNDPSAIPHLLKSLTHKNIAVRQSAALSVGSAALRGDSEAIMQLFHCYSKSTDKCLKGFCILSIGKIGGHTATKHLKLIFKRGTSSDLPWAGLALGLAMRTEQDETVLDRMRDQFKSHANRSTRGALAVGLGLARCREAVPELIAGMKDGDDPYLRGYCAIALGMIGNQAALPALRAALGEHNLPQLNTQAAMALCLLDDEESVTLLTDIFLKTRCEATKMMTSRSLVYLGGMDTVEELLDFVATQLSDEMTYQYCLDLISKILVGQKIPYLDRVAASSNFACEFPIVPYLLDFGI